MATSIKNCGIQTLEVAQAAIANGAAFLGFVHYAPSPRHMPLKAIAQLTKTLKNTPAKNVLVTVKPDDVLLKNIRAMEDIHLLQIHGVADTGRLQAIQAQSAKPLIIGLGVATAEDIQTAKSLTPYAKYLLFDYKTPAHGGSGKTFDWGLLKNLTLPCPWFLAGGLNQENVATAIAQTGARYVDVSSGIEDAPGQKSLKKIAGFNQAVLQA